jgi:hypothetical protein
MLWALQKKRKISIGGNLEVDVHSFEETCNLLLLYNFLAVTTVNCAIALTHQKFMENHSLCYAYELHGSFKKTLEKNSS